MTRRETSAEIDRDAADWAARLDRGPLSDADAEALEAWRRGDPRRNGAFARAQAVMDHLDRAQALGPTYDPANFRDAKRFAPSRRQLLWGGGGAIAASIAAVSAGIVVLGAQTQYAAKKGEVRLVSLTDGSVVTLNSASKVAANYSKAAREVTLLEGEALFDVAKNPKRPFVVDAGDTRIRAVGTSFTVKRLPGQRTQVVVREGVVEITRKSASNSSSPAAAPTPALRLAANEVMIATPNAPLTALTLTPADLGRELAWKDGMIAFRRTPLKEAAAEFARYSDTKILIDDPEVGDRTVTGLFSAYNPVGFAKSAAESLELQARVDDGAVHLSR